MTFRTYTRTVAASQSSELNVSGAGVACIESNLPNFGIQAENEPQSDFFRGAQLDPPGGFTKLVIINKDATVALTVTLAIWDGGFVDRRLITAPQAFEPASVSEMRGVAFAKGGVIAAVALQHGFIQAANVSADKLIALTSMVVTASGSGEVFIAHGGTSTVPANPIGNLNPKFSGDPIDASTNFAVEANASPAFLLGSGVFSLDLAAGVPAVKKLDVPLVIPPGRMVFWRGPINTTVTIGTEWLRLPGA